MIYYRSMVVSTSPPSSPGLGQIWIKPLETATYQSYIWLNEWSIFVSGGTYISETDPDTHYINVIVQDSQPTDIKLGWIWINSITMQAYLYIFDYILLAGA